MFSDVEAKAAAAMVPARVILIWNDLTLEPPAMAVDRTASAVRGVGLGLGLAVMTGLALRPELAVDPGPFEPAGPTGLVVLAPQKLALWKEPPVSQMKAGFYAYWVAGGEAPYSRACDFRHAPTP
jgi:DNA-binding transcriptional LysR family regulator